VGTHDNQGMVTVELCSVFSQEDAAGLADCWFELAASLAERFARVSELMAQARDDMLEFRHFPLQALKKVWSTNLIERVNEEVKH